MSHGTAGTNKHIPFASLSEPFTQNTVICTAPSKTFNLAGLSTSNIIIPNEELKRRYEAGAMYGQGGNGHVRINIGCQRSTVIEALNRLEKAIRC